MGLARRSPVQVVLIAFLGTLSLAPPGQGQPRVTPHIYSWSGDVVGGAPWALPVNERQATIVSGLPVPHRYRVCNESNTPAVVWTDVVPKGFVLPARSCADIAAKTIVIEQRTAGIPPRGSYLPLD
jgi:hypothetical protein